MKSKGAPIALVSATSESPTLNLLNASRLNVAGYSVSRNSGSRPSTKITTSPQPTVAARKILHVVLMNLKQITKAEAQSAVGAAWELDKCAPALAFSQEDLRKAECLCVATSSAVASLDPTSVLLKASLRTL